ncbi:T9SS type B sorting domain-containing protein [Sabulilitoribacter arenilitoris]|uniref:T9SS type B sorting domain-containing protein n=1 Tax=Wocania arenilitoris TaxID=2044858 RepID=A0AAE3JMB3_9FLAO|nr:T9SS type B sorting domain-containing protein [Wocania arenilitoris]MCF7567591.1 T9SS type B sorting domain-containing protein [Wocania arenilitoris]
MKKSTYVINGLVVVFLFLSVQLAAQTYKPFTVRKNVEVRGSMLVVGNSILGQDNLSFNDDSRDNQDISMQYIDIDSDVSTFSSSSAELSLPLQSDGSATTCYRVVYAALYWGAIMQDGDRSNINQVKLQLPGSTTYNDLTGEIVYDAIVNPIIAETGEPGNTPYACYAEVTDLLSSLTDVEGTYTVGNVTASLGFNHSTGLAAGWTLFVIYEDPNLHTKSFTSFDGFSHIYDGHQETVPVSGFTTPPGGHIDLQFGYATLDGDRTKRATKLEINGKEVTTPLRPANKFFGSVIENGNGISNPRNPFSTNTLGYDTGFLEILNAEPEFITNNETSADFRLQVARGQADPIFAFFSTFAVDIISPDIDLIKTVEDEFGNDIDGDDVILGQNLFYEITYQSVGNDNVTEFTIKDILPDNINFDPATDIDLSNAGGATLQSYDPVTRTLIFNIPDESVEVDDPQFVIRIAIQVVPNCYDLSQACSNEIQNQAFATYRGVLNPTIIEEEGSFATTECLGIPGSTNFIVDISNCDFTREEILCGNSVLLTAADGYDSYSWSTSSTGAPVIGTDQTYMATTTGTYYVTNTTAATCISIEEAITVTQYGSSLTNPIIPYADLLPVCPNDGKVLPYIFLCGGNDSRTINTGISDAVSIIWEQLDETSCPAITVDDCANENESCTWNQVATGPDFIADTSGEFRIVINYPGGCFSIFYFNVYQNLLTPTVTAEDILCTTAGEITVGGVPSGYEYSIDGVNYQPSNIFTVNTPGFYVIYIRQIGVPTNPCIFQTPSVHVRQRDFNVTTNITQPICNGGTGGINIAVNEALPQYYYSIYEGGTLVNSVGPILASDYEFSSLNPGSYTINVTTDDGCTYSEDFDIIEPPLLTATLALTNPLTCTDGEITVYPSGGTPPFTYFVNGSTISQDSPIISVPTAGVYNVTVVDFNNCSTEVSLDVEAIQPPDFNVGQTNILCSNDLNSGTITISVANPNGNSLRYSIDNGISFANSPTFTGLTAGNYDVVVEYTLGVDVCSTAPQQITITALGAVTGVATLTTHYTCTSQGIITVSGVSGGTAPYSYSLDGITFQSGLTFNGLLGGTYTVMIRDANDCTFLTAPITIAPLNPPTDLIFANSPLSCPTLVSDVTITGTTGGALPLEYQIIAPAGSVTPYQSSNIFTGLAPDTYTFQVRDANNCLYSESYTIAPLPFLTVSTVLTKNLDCTISPDGIITGTINGGVAPFNYEVSFNGGAYTLIGATGSPFVHSAASDGTYQFRITDANGCIAVSGLEVVTAIDPVTASTLVSDPTCNGFSDGSIQLNALTGLPPFIYSIDGGASFVSSNVFGGLVAGTYNYVLRDSKNCETSGTLNITNPLPLDVSIVRNAIQCSPNIPGSLDVTINSGGVSPFTYTLYDNTYTQIGLDVTTASTTHTFSGLSFGDYYVTIIDSNGCEYRSTALRIETPPNLNLTAVASTGSCTTGATVDLEVVAGAGPFTYSIYGQPATSIGPTGSTTHTFSNLNHGVTYLFQVIDGGGCFSIIEVTTPILSPININTVTTTNVSCNGSGNGTINFTVSDYDASVTTIYYEVQDELTNTAIIPAQNGTFAGLTGAPANGSISGLPAGNYTLFVREVDGTLCTTSQSFQITQPIQPLVVAFASEINANCNADAQVTVTATGGVGPYEYAAGALGFVPLPGDFGSNNVLNLDYAIRTNWDIVVRDSNGCEDRINRTIVADPEPVISATLNNQCTVTEGNFEIDVTLTMAGMPPYSFSIDGGAFQTGTAPFTISSLTSGSHTVEIRDINGCGNLVTVDIAPPLDLTPSITTFPTCNDDDGEITITGLGGTGTYSYAISPSPGSISLAGNIFSGVPSGTYAVTITDTITLCTEDVSIVVPVAIPPTFTTTPNAITCFGDNNGSFEINVNGYSGPYSYEVFDSSSTSVFGVVNANTSTNPELVTGVLAGTYTVVITETASPFCSATSSVIIPSPLNALSVVATETSNVTCDNNLGTITAIATGGWGTYEYELTGTVTVAYSSNGTFTNLSAGVYTVNVRDVGGCIASDSVTLIVPPAITATVTANTPLLSCFGDSNATISASLVTGGQGSNYTYTLNMTSPTVSSSGPQTSPVFNGLGAGTYNVIVSDGYNCVFTSTDVVISEPTQIQASLVATTTPTCTTDATLTLSATGGTGTYEYSDSITFGTILGTFVSSTTFSVADGTYSYYVRDVNGCIANISNEITIDPLPTLLVNLDVSNATINCAGDSTGVIVATAVGGLGSYVYTLQDTSGTNITPAPTQNSAGVFTDLPEGNYQVRVDSGDCLATSAQISITEPAAPLSVNFTVTNVTCPGTNNGMLEINATGGTGIIKYAISPQLNQFFEESTFENLASGSYQAMAQDELGCFIIFDFDVIEPIPVMLTIVPNSILPEVCDGDLDGEFSIDISGGNMPYSVALDDINGTYTTGILTQTQFDFTGLAGGDHIVYVRDALGCETEWNITFPESVLLDPQVNVEYCTDIADASSNAVIITIDNSVDPVDVDYSLDGVNFQTSNTFVDVLPGLNQSITVRHTNGCEQVVFFDVNQYDPLEIALSDGGINEIESQASGGSGGYEYAIQRVNTVDFEPYQNTGTFIIYESGEYTVTVTDSNGCVTTAIRYFEFIDVCITNYFTPNGDGNMDEWGPGCTSQYRDLTFNIFDRYGRRVATLKAGQKWDGRYQGKELPTGDYWYVVKLNDSRDNREFVGHFTLYR